MALDRRGFLRLAGLTAVAGVAGCSGSRPASGPTRAPTATSASRSAPQSSVAAPWSTLRDRLAGDLVRPGDRGYPAAIRLANPRFDGARHPQGVAFCASADDVAAAVRFAADTGVPLAVRSGGHSYGGWSVGPGLVVDVSRLASVAVDARAGQARIGAGARLVEVYAGFAAHGVGIPAGSCPTVGLAGLALGGGVGVLARAWGLTCDSVAGVEIVTADGTVRQATADAEPDLYWACRGGGGNFGVVTAFTLRTRPAPDVTTFYLQWDWRYAADVLDGWQHWTAAAPDQVWSTCKLLNQPGRGPRVFVAGTHVGSPALPPQLAKLVDAVGAAPAVRTARTLGYLDAMRTEAGCANLRVGQCRFAPAGALQREREAATSHVVERTICADAIRTAVDQVERAGALRGLREGGVSFDALGGAVGRVDPAATAFPHRSALATVQYTATWATGGAAAYDDYVRGFRTAMTPCLGTTAYVNYPDPSLPDWPQAYYGANYPRLQRVKRRYDPDGLFTFAQSVRG